MPSPSIALDAQSARTKDANGFLHVQDNPVTREQVAVYYGNEIPMCEALGLDPKKEYRLYRPGSELARAAPTICRLPLELMHNETDAENLPKAQIIGSLGSDPRFDGEYLRISLCVHDADAIRRIESEELKELSLAYQYDLDMTPGQWQGQEYDGVMRNLRGNHLALVDVGRAGPTVVVRDNAPKPQTTEPQMPQKKTVLLPAGLVGRLLRHLKGGRMAKDAAPGEIESQEKALTEELAKQKVLELVEKAADTDPGDDPGKDSADPPAKDEGDPIPKAEATSSAHSSWPFWPTCLKKNGLPSPPCWKNFCLLRLLTKNSRPRPQTAINPKRRKRHRMKANPLTRPKRQRMPPTPHWSGCRPLWMPSATPGPYWAKPRSMWPATAPKISMAWPCAAWAWIRPACPRALCATASLRP